MKVLGVCGWSGAGKTTLITALVAGLRARGLRVAVIKHAHHGFDIDRPGKDSWRHREAGAQEVLIASDRRMALLREFEPGASPPDVQALLAGLSPCDWVLVEGYKQAGLPKLEVWRPGQGREPLHPQDSRILAVATDQPAALQPGAGRAVLDLNQPEAVLDWLLAQAACLDRPAPVAEPGLP